jgi:transcriptional regulator with XRE-family HTH domain
MAEETPAAAGTPAPGPTAGGLLRRAREAQGLHIAVLAASLKVPQRKLEALERDRLDELPDATFARALAQTMCRALKIDPAPVLDLLPRAGAGGATLDQVSAGLNTPFRDKTSAVEPAVGLVLRHPATVLVGLLLAAALALWFWPRKPAAPIPVPVTESVPPPHPPGPGELGRKGGDHRWRRTGARAVDDQHRHGGRHRHRDPGQGTRHRGLGDGAHHRQHARGGRGGAAHPRAARPHGHRRAADRRLPLQRPPSAHRVPGDGPGAVEVPHQPGQCRQGRQEGPPVRDDGRGGDEAPESGAHRRQLGQPGPGTAGVDDGRERAARRALGRPPGHVPGADRIGARLGHLRP